MIVGRRVSCGEKTPGSLFDRVGMLIFLAMADADGGFSAAWTSLCCPASALRRGRLWKVQQLIAIAAAYVTNRMSHLQKSSSARDFSS
jgi:hypothetical protein